MRITPNWKLDDVKKLIDGMCAEAGPDVSYEFIQFSNIIAQTSTDDSNIWWKTFHGVCKEL